jgi:hypothetical protein
MNASEVKSLQAVQGDGNDIKQNVDSKCWKVLSWRRFTMACLPTAYKILYKTVASAL